MIVDTHCHLDFPEFENDLDEVLERASGAGVKYIINVASSINGCRNGKALASKIQNVYYSLGIHPHHASEYSKEDLDTIRKMAFEKEKLVAIGEVGLDFYKNFSPRDVQVELFERFLNMKKELGLPLIIHSREAGTETIDILKSSLGASVNGVMHCFSGGLEYLKEVLDLGMHVSFTANITYRSAEKLREVIKYVPMDRLLIETDAPFLSPLDMRGKRNEPSYLVYLVEAISSLLHKTKQEIEETTSYNAVKLFGLE